MPPSHDNAVDAAPRDLQDWLRLLMTPGVGPERARALLRAFGLPEQVFAQRSEALRAVVSPSLAQALLVEPPELGAALTRTRSWLTEGPDRRIVTLGDADYPQALLRLDDPPLLLYLRGRGAPGGLGAAVAMVGSRNPTPQGEEHARAFARHLAAAGLTVVSGLARGIDAAAHHGALQGAADPARIMPTVAVVGTGLDRVYPKDHLTLAQAVCQHGLLISEYPLGTPPKPENFPRRNRLIAALSQGTLVVEAALQSGSLITARLAAEMGKDVFAVPGSILTPQARGCHALIRQGAQLVESADEVLATLRGAATNAMLSVAPCADATGAGGQMDSEASVRQAIGFDPVGLDALQARCNLSTAELQTQLLTLELQGLVRRLPGGLYQRSAASA